MNDDHAKMIYFFVAAQNEMIPKGRCNPKFDKVHMPKRYTAVWTSLLYERETCI